MRVVDTELNKLLLIYLLLFFDVNNNFQPTAQVQDAAPQYQEPAAQYELFPGNAPTFCSR